MTDVREGVHPLVEGKLGKYSAPGLILHGGNNVLLVGIAHVKRGDDHFLPILPVLKKLEDV